VEAIEEELPAGFWTDLVAEFVGATRVLSLEGGGSAERLGEGVGGGARLVKEVVVRCCHDADFPAETLDLAPAHHLCTPFSFTNKMKTFRYAIKIFIFKDVPNFSIQPTHKSSNSRFLALLYFTTQHTHL
jgi:hypothetical protein